jgi:ribose transport system substrate-binding protein
LSYRQDNYGLRRTTVVPTRKASLCAPLTIAVLALAGCGGDDTGGGAAAAPASGAVKAGIEHAKTQIEKYRAVPSFQPPGPAFDARKAAAGKTLLSIPASSSIPFVQTIQNGIKGISGQVGMNFIDWPNQGKPVQWVQGMNQALDRKANVINLLAGINPGALGPQIAKAEGAGASVVASHLYDVNQPATNGADSVSIYYEQAGRLLADWVIAETGGKADVLAVTINEVVSTKPMMTGINDEFAKHCGSGCKVSSVNTAIADVATRIQPQVQSALVKDPKINYVIALYDSAEAPFVVAGIRQAGAKGRVKVVTFNGTPSVLKMVKAGDVEMDVGESLDWISYGVMDQVMRLAAGMDPVKDPKLPIRIFDESNVDETGTPPTDSKGYGDSYRDGYMKLWGLK